MCSELSQPLKYGCNLWNIKSPIVLKPRFLVILLGAVWFHHENLESCPTPLYVALLQVELGIQATSGMGDFLGAKNRLNYHIQAYLSFF